MKIYWNPDVLLYYKKSLKGYIVNQFQIIGFGYLFLFEFDLYFCLSHAILQVNYGSLLI